MMKMLNFILLLLITTLVTSGSAFAQKFFSVRKMPFSGPLSNEFAPVIYKNGVVFCSDRRNTIY
jgi:hypothetical protein